ncbi:MAG: DUF1559 domain-containing protein, partial [Planctomycetia bacterium]|nr:DUF1559 domain-containing protein [Planctomycetia bacterium]
LVQIDADESNKAGHIHSHGRKLRVRGRKQLHAMEKVTPFSRPLHGFTLVELLAVIAIIGLLVGLLVPGVQSARESSRRSACANNIRQLGQGLQQFHAAHGSLPVTGAAHPIYAVTSPNYPTYRRYLGVMANSDVYCVYTWVVAVLPYVDQLAFFNQFNLRQQSNSPTNLPLVQTPVSLLICPSDPDATSPIFPRRGFPAISVASSTDADGSKMHGLWYAGSAGPSQEYGANQYCPSGSSPGTASGWCWARTTDSRGETGALDMGNRVGMFGGRYLPTKFDDVQDGLSNTFLLVETQPKFSPHNGAYTSFTGSFNANPVVTVSAQINMPLLSTDSPFLNAAGTYNGSRAIAAKSPRSAHPGGCHMLMCDGAVVFFSDLTPLQLLCRLGNRKDGEIAIVP